MTTPLRVLHTSDWHLGRRLYGHTRYQEFAEFLDWLYNCICEQAVDVLIVAGDIFDSMTPSNKAQALYYQFLGRVSHSPCQHIIIVAGNHDSPSLLDAPKEVLKFLNVHIVGTACDNIEDEVITLTDHNQQAQAIILAVPYLRDKDVRHSVSAESSDDKNSQLVAGISEHYAKATAIAKQRQTALQTDLQISSQKKLQAEPKTKRQKQQQTTKKIPIIATGHLMAMGGKTTDDDGVRELYIGSLGGISANIFDKDIDYVALGHLHVPQLVGGEEHIRYSGSPIAMGFGEAKQQKQVLLITFDNNKQKDKQKDIRSIAVPCFHKLAQVKGDFSEIEQQLIKLKTLKQAVWVEVIYQSDKVISNLAEQLSLITKDSDVEIIKIKNSQSYQQILRQSSQSESLHDLTCEEVFERCLTTHKVADNQRNQLMQCFQQVIYEIENEDIKSE